MKTLTITDAKKNLGQWLNAAARGEDIGIISGADIIALRKVEVESTDYAFREYGLDSRATASLEQRVERDYQTEKTAGRLRTFTSKQLRQWVEKTTRHQK